MRTEAASCLISYSRTTDVEVKFKSGGNRLSERRSRLE